MTKIGNSGYKYDYDVAGIEFQKDIEEKNRLNEEFKETLLNLFNKQIKYRDGRLMSRENKWQLFTEVAKNIYKTI